MAVHGVCPTMHRDAAPRPAWFYVLATTRSGPEGGFRADQILLAAHPLFHRGNSNSRCAHIGRPEWQMTPLFVRLAPAKIDAQCPRDRFHLICALRHRD